MLLHIGWGFPHILQVILHCLGFQLRWHSVGVIWNRMRIADDELGFDSNAAGRHSLDMAIGSPQVEVFGAFLVWGH